MTEDDPLPKIGWKLSTGSKWEDNDECDDKPASDSEPFAEERKLVFAGTVRAIDNSPVDNSTLNWIVTVSVDEIISGAFSGKEFNFRIHSPAKSGLEVEKSYEIEAVLTQDGYTVDPYQWMKQK